MTSSVAVISYGRGRGVHRFTEADWTQLGLSFQVSPYIQSKTIAERAARDWVAAEGQGIEFCTINPSVVLGWVARPVEQSIVETARCLIALGIVKP